MKVPCQIPWDSLGVDVFGLLVGKVMKTGQHDSVQGDAMRGPGS